MKPVTRGWLSFYSGNVLGFTGLHCADQKVFFGSELGGAPLEGGGRIHPCFFYSLTLFWRIPRKTRKQHSVTNCLLSHHQLLLPEDKHFTKGPEGCWEEPKIDQRQVLVLSTPRHRGSSVFCCCCLLLPQLPKKKETPPLCSVLKHPSSTVNSFLCPSSASLTTSPPPPPLKSSRECFKWHALTLFFNRVEDSAVEKSLSLSPSRMARLSKRGGGGIRGHVSSKPSSLSSLPAVEANLWSS